MMTSTTTIERIKAVLPEEGGYAPAASPWRRAVIGRWPAPEGGRTPSNSVVGVEAVSGASDGGYEGGGFGPVYFLSEVPDVHVHDVGAGVEGIVPYGVQNLLAGEDLSGVAHEVFEEGELAAGEVHSVAAHPGAVGEEIHFEAAGRYLRGRRLVVAADQSPYPGDELLEGEGLRHIVVGSGVEGGDLARKLVAGGEHEDREAGLLATDPFKHLVSVEAGEHDVEEDDVHILVERETEPVVAVVRAHGLVSVRCEAALEHARNARLVLHDKNPHKITSAPPTISAQV